jgi:putative ABC transport system permease protein
MIPLRSPGLSLIERARHAGSDLWNRRRTVALSAASVAVAVLFLLVLGHLAQSVSRFRAASSSAESAARVVVTARDATDPAERFGPERVARFAALPGAARAFPKVEVGGRAWALADAPAAATAEGAPGDDPALTPERLAWGRAPHAPDEVVLSRAAFERLGGRVTDRGPEPTRLTFEVVRTTGGREEARRAALRVCGLARGTDEALRVPLELAAALDDWCAHATGPRAGHLRCAVDATDPDAAEALVARFRAEGYPVAHKLDDVAAHRHLNRVLAAVVLVLVCGYLLSATLTVFTTSAQQVAAKGYEIGVLRALGVGRREIVSAYALQGLFTGLFAFALGAGGAVALEPLVSGALVSACGVPEEALATRLADPAHLSLFGIALVVAVAASALGAVAPAIGVARSDLVASLRRVG